MEKIGSYLVLLFMFSKIHGQTSPCFLFDATSLDRVKEIKTSFHFLKQTQTGIHDTLATDLFLVIKDLETDQPLKEGQAMLNYSIFKSPDSTGRVNFNYFGTGGVYTLIVSCKKYHCLEITNLHFSSGEMRWLEIKLKKAN